MNINKFKWLTKWLLSIGLLTLGLGSLSTVMAAPIFTITTTDQSVTVGVGETATITYTVKNTSGINMPQMGYFPPPLTTIDPSSTCGTTLANGASCTVILIFHAPTQPGQIKLGSLGVCGFNGKICSQPNQNNLVVVHVIVITTVLPLLMAGGSEDADPFRAFLVASFDNGVTWTNQTINGTTASRAIVDASCTGHGSDAVCAVTGSTVFTDEPYLVTTSDAGTTWVVNTITGGPANGFLTGAGCTGEGATAICVAVGADDSSIPGGTAPLVAVSTDGAKTWTPRTVALAPAEAFFFGASCTGTGSTAICAIAGVDNTLSNAAPLLAVSIDGGATWTKKVIIPSPAAEGSFFNTACTGTGATAVCTAVGADFPAGSAVPLLAVSTDGGVTWTKKTVTGAPAKGFFFGTACTGNGPTAICTAVGFDVTGLTFPVLAVSTDGGNNWATKTITGFSSQGVLLATACSGGDSGSPVCTAVGSDEGSPRQPLIVVSTDGGNTWQAKTATNPPVGAGLVTTICTGSGATAICLAGGQEDNGTSTNPPVLIVSVDGGVTWTVKPVADVPASGFYAATGAATGPTVGRSKLSLSKRKK